MRLLKSTIHPDVLAGKGKSFHRQAARGIILNGDNILMLYTARYHEYTQTHWKCMISAGV